MSGQTFVFADLQARAQSVGGVRDSADWVIIGSGAAGATAARVLSEAGADVIVVEEGSPLPPNLRPHDSWTAFRRAWRDAGMQVAQGRALLPILQGSAVGGSTVIYGAIVHRIPEVIHNTWATAWGLGEALPLPELTRIYDQLDRELSVAPGPRDILGQNNLLMHEAMEACGGGGHVIERNVVGCEGVSRCLQGCPRARKQSMDVTFLPAAVARGARIYANTQARTLLREADRAVGVVGQIKDPETGKRGATVSLHARRGVLVAASAIQTPIFLRQNGIGRASGLVGERLQAHPGTSVLGVFDEPVKMWFGATQGYETTRWWNERLKYETVGAPLDVMASRLPGFGAKFVERVADWGHITQWGVQIRAHAHGRVRPGWLTDAAIRYSLTKQDANLLKQGVMRLAELQFAAGARAILPNVLGLPDEVTSMDQMKPLMDLPDDPRLFHGIASHLFGTAVMGSDPRRSVVGLDGQCHDVRGLYVLDSSLYPTNMGVNPAHTICAVSWLLSERLVA